MFMEIKLIDPPTKLLSNKGIIYNQPEILPKGGDYVNKLKATKKTSMQCNSLKIYVNYQLESAIPFKKSLNKMLVFFPH